MKPVFARTASGISMFWKRLPVIELPPLNPQSTRITRRSGIEGPVAISEYAIGMSVMPWLLQMGQPPIMSVGIRPRA